MWAGTQFALVGQGPDNSNSSVLVIADSGHRVRVSRPGCLPAQPPPDTPLDLPWVAFWCGTDGSPVELYSPRTGQWQTFTPSSTNANPCAGAPDCDLTNDIAAAGTVWVEFFQGDCVPYGQHCSSQRVFENIANGSVSPDRSGGSKMNDLDAVGLIRSVCAPLKVPTAWQLVGPPEPGSLTFYGPFALAIGTDANLIPTAYLERCGTHLQRALVTAPYPGNLLAPAANTHMVLWKSAHGLVLNGLTFPAERPFSVDLPRRITAGKCAPPTYTGACVLQIALTQHRLYVLIDPTGQLWATNSPTLAPAKHRKHGSNPQTRQHSPLSTRGSDHARVSERDRPPDGSGRWPRPSSASDLAVSIAQRSTNSGS